jgi:hypothetical protein
MVILQPPLVFSAVTVAITRLNAHAGKARTVAAHLERVAAGLDHLLTWCDTLTVLPCAHTVLLGRSLTMVSGGPA